VLTYCLPDDRVRPDSYRGYSGGRKRLAQAGMLDVECSEDCCQYWKVDRLRKHATLNKSALNTQVVTTEKANKICIQCSLKGSIGPPGRINTTKGWVLNGPA